MATLLPSLPLRWRGFGLLLGAILLSLPAAGPASGAAPLSFEAPVFYLETIRVEGLKHASREIVVSESLLEEGQAYSEDQLRDAVYRIGRLPFVLDAEFSLRKGSVRDRYELVISVVAAPRKNFTVEASQTEYDSNEFGFETFGETLLAGRRFFLGKYGVLFAAIGDEEDGISVGYNHYNLFDRSILLSASYSRELTDSDIESQRLSLGLGVPLRTNQSLRFSLKYSFADAESPFLGGFPGRIFSLGDSEAWEVETAWTFNSLDDPVFPTSGLLLDAAFTYADASNELKITDTSFTPPMVDIQDSSAETFGLQLEARRHWRFARRQSFSLAARGFAGRSRFSQEGPAFQGSEVQRRSDDTWSFRAGVGHFRFLQQSRSDTHWRELRWENRLESETLRRPADVFRRAGTETAVILGTGLAYRNGWGVFRFTLRYVWDDEDSGL